MLYDKLSMKIEVKLHDTAGVVDAMAGLAAGCMAGCGGRGRCGGVQVCGDDVVNEAAVACVGGEAGEAAAAADVACGVSNAATLVWQRWQEVVHAATAGPCGGSRQKRGPEAVVGLLEAAAMLAVVEI